MAARCVSVSLNLRQILARLVRVLLLRHACHYQSLAQPSLVRSTVVPEKQVVNLKELLVFHRLSVRLCTFATRVLARLKVSVCLELANFDVALAYFFEMFEMLCMRACVRS